MSKNNNIILNSLKLKLKTCIWWIIKIKMVVVGPFMINISKNKRSIFHHRSRSKTPLYFHIFPRKVAITNKYDKFMTGKCPPWRGFEQKKFSKLKDNSPGGFSKGSFCEQSEHCVETEAIWSRRRKSPSKTCKSAISRGIFCGTVRSVMKDNSIIAVRGYLLTVHIYFVAQQRNATLLSLEVLGIIFGCTGRDRQRTFKSFQIYPFFAS